MTHFQSNKPHFSQHNDPFKALTFSHPQLEPCLQPLFIADVAGMRRFSLGARYKNTAVFVFHWPAPLPTSSFHFWFLFVLVCPPRRPPLASSQPVIYSGGCQDAAFLTLLKLGIHLQLVIFPFSSSFPQQVAST